MLKMDEHGPCVDDLPIKNAGLPQLLGKFPGKFPEDTPSEFNDKAHD